MTDRGEPGTFDSIGFNLTDRKGKLFYSSNWSGISTEEMTLSKGNLLIHSGFSIDNGSTSTIAARTLDVNDFENYTIEVKSWPNPSDSYFNLKAISTNSVHDVNVLVFDVNNRLVHRGKFKPQEEYQFGYKLEGGVYIVNLEQADKTEIIRLVKY